MGPFSSEEAIPRNLQLLNLEENGISDWRAVLRLKSLAKLESADAFS